MKAKKKEKDISNNELKKQNIKLKSDLDGFKRLMVLLIILVLVSVLSQGLYFYSLEYEKKTNTANVIDTNKRQTEEIKTEPLDVNSEEVKTLIGKVDVFNNQLESSNFFGYFYKKDSYSVENMSNKAKIYMALSNISFVDNKEFIDDKDNVSIPKRFVKEKIEELFGEKVTYEDEALVEDGNDCRMAYFGYDYVTENYILNSFGHNQAAYTNKIETNITKATKRKNTIEIEISMYKAIPTKEGYTIYKDMNSDIEITKYEYGQEVDIFNTYKDELQQYKYTFVLENDHYIFSKIEKIN